MTKLPVQKLTQRKTQKQVQHHDATDIYKKLYFCGFRIFSFFLIDNFLNEFSKNY